MKQLQALVMLVGIFWCSFSGLAAQPVLDVAEVGPDSTQIISESVTVWVNETTDWRLQFLTSPECELWYYFDDDWHSSLEPLTGSSSETASGFMELAVKLQIPWLAPGEYQMPIAIEMSHGNGLLSLEFDNMLWFLALGSNEYWLTCSGEKHELSNEQWLSLPVSYDELTIYWQDTQLWPQLATITPLSAASIPDEFAPGLAWQTNQLELTSGNDSAVKLTIDALIPGSRIYLDCSPGIALHEMWELRGETLTPCMIWLQSDNTGNYIDIPGHVTPGSYQLNGTVLARLGVPDQALTALYQGYQIDLPIVLTRGWFGETGRVIVYVSDGYSPVANLPLLLPNGEVEETDHAGYLEFLSPPGVQRIIGVNQPDQVIWYDVAINETIYLELELDAHKPNQGLVVWDFAWEPDFTWALAVLGQDVEFRLQPDQEQVSFKQKHDGFAYDYHRRGHDSKISLTYSPGLKQDSEVKDGWTRSGSSARQRLVYEATNYGVTIDMNKRPWTLSGIRWHYKQPQWNLAVGDQYVKIGTKLDDYQIDALYRYGSDWSLKLSKIVAGWQIQLTPEYLKLQGKLKIGRLPWQWKIAQHRDKSLQVALESKQQYSLLRLEADYAKQRWLPAIRVSNTLPLRKGAIGVNLVAKAYSAQSLAELLLAYRLPLGSKSQLLVKHGYRYHGDLSDLQQISGISFSHRISDLGYVQVGWDNEQGTYWRCALAVIGWN